jgi:hypothetical protein
MWYLWLHHPDASNPCWVDRDIIHFSVNTNWESTRYHVHFVDRHSGSHLTETLSYRDCLNNRQHAETTKKGGWAGLVAPKSSAELARANKEAAAFAAVLREQQLQEKQQLMPNSYHHQKMRAEVAGFVRRFREEFKARWSTNVEYKCPITGSPITSLQDCQVDHYDPPFAVLAELWLQQEGTQLADVATWTDAQKSSWADYHNTHAKLRMVSRAGNMSKAVEDRKATVAIRQRRNAQ